MKNFYFILRHGESFPNIRGIILSDPDEGEKDDHTLTKHGEDQVAHSAREAKEQGLLDGGTIIYASPFSRCKKTAEIVKNILGVETDIIFDGRLRERWFGNWEGTGNINYQKVWDRDISDPNHSEANVESTAEVLQRVKDLIQELERTYSGENILFVSHGDALQILQTFFEDRAPAEHRQLPHLKVAEVRKIN